MFRNFCIKLLLHTAHGVWHVCVCVCVCVQESKLTIHGRKEVVGERGEGKEKR